MKVFNLSRNTEEFTCNVYKYGKILIDTGTGSELRTKLEDIEELEAILLTHTHYDHVDNLEFVVEKFDPEIYCFDSERIEFEATELEDREVFEVDNRTVKAFHTPGHIDDHLCYFFLNEKILFTGDLIFSGGSFGRTDLEEGDRELLINSIKQISNHTSPDRFYPGHGQHTIENCKERIRESLEEAEKGEPKY